VDKTETLGMALN